MPVVSSGQLTLTDLNDSKQLILYLNANYRTQVYDPTATTYTPNFTASNLIITPELYIAGGDGTNLLPNAQVQSLAWYEGTQTTTAIPEASGTDYTVPTGAVGTTAKPLTVKTNFTAKNSQIFTCVVVYRDPDTGFDATLKANIEIVKLTNGAKGNAGANAITAVLSNDADTVPSDSNGNAQVITGVTATITVYEGATDVTSSWSMGTPVVTGMGALNTAYTLTGTPANRTFTLTGTNPLTADVATVTWTLTRSGYSNITKVFTIARVRNGVAGTSPTLYRFLPSANAIKKDQAGVYSPASIVLEGKSQTGTGAYGAYNGRFKIYTTTAVLNASTNWGTAVYTSASDQSTYTYPASGTFPAGITGIKIELYLAGGTTTLIDSQVIPVVTDGIDSYLLNVWTPNGDTIRNGSGDMVVQADLYKGAGTITPTATQWYIQDPTATTASGGNADGGNGWRLIKTVANPTTAPTLALVANANTVTPVGTYYVKYTWCGLSGETIGSTQATLAVTAGNDLRVTIPAFGTDVVKARVYAGLATGDANLKYQGDITVSAGNMVITKLYTDSEAIPTVTSASITSTQQSITVRPWAIAGVEGFKCVATSGSKYTGVTIVKDFTDPITVSILGANIFKNGEGSVKLTAQLLQAGVSVPTSGYSFAWSIYKTDGTLHKVLAGTTDTVTVLASDIDGIGNVVVDVSK